MLLAEVWMPLLAACLWWWMHSLWLQLGVPLEGSVLTGVQVWLAVSSLLLFAGYRKLAREHHSGAELHAVEIPTRRTGQQTRSHSWSAGVNPLASAVMSVGFVACFLCLGRNQEMPAAIAGIVGLLALVKNYFLRPTWSCDGQGLVTCAGRPAVQQADLRAVVLQADSLQVCLLDQTGRMLVVHQDQTSKYRRHAQALRDVQSVGQGIRQALDLPWLADLGHYQVEGNGAHWKLLGSKLRPSGSLLTIGAILLVCTPMLAVLDMFFLNLLLTKLQA